MVLILFGDDGYWLTEREKIPNNAHNYCLKVRVARELLFSPSYSSSISRYIVVWILILYMSPWSGFLSEDTHTA